MPDLTWANPLVGSDAGHPITKLAALNGRVLTDQDLAGVDEPVDDVVDVRRIDGDLEVLGGVPVGDGDGVVERVDEHAAAVRAERRAAPPRRAAPGRSASWRSSSASVASASADDRCVTSTTERVGAVLGLDQQVGGESRRVGRVVGDHRLSVGPSSIIVDDAVALHLDLGDRDGRRARADDLADPGNRLGAEAERGDPGRPVDAEHVARCRACDTPPARPGRPRPTPPGNGGTTSASSGTPATIAGTASW